MEVDIFCIQGAACFNKSSVVHAICSSICKIFFKVFLYALTFSPHERYKNGQRNRIQWRTYVKGRWCRMMWCITLLLAFQGSNVKHVPIQNQNIHLTGSVETQLMLHHFIIPNSTTSTTYWQEILCRELKELVNQCHGKNAEQQCMQKQKSCIIHSLLACFHPTNKEQ